MINNITQKAYELSEQLIKTRREKLKKFCHEALDNPKFMKRKKKTFCNLAARFIAESMGVITKICNVFLMWTRSGQKWITGTANVIAKNAEKLAVEGKIQEIYDLDEAQGWQWMGYIILYAWKNPNRRSSGHVAIGYPTEPGKEPLKICNIGWNNLICEPNNKKAFGSLPFKIYRLPMII